MKTTDIISDNIYGAVSDGERIYVRSVLDKIAAAEKGCAAGFMRFAGQAKQELGARALRSAHCDDYMFWGGYENAERRMLGVFAAGVEPSRVSFPVSSLTVSYPYKGVKLSHRDFLGAFMSQGISRGSIGDILVSDGAAVAFMTDTAARVILNVVTSVGGVGVVVSSGHDEGSLPEANYTQMRGAVSSLRIDCITAFAARCPRSRAERLVKGGGVRVKGHTDPETDDRLSEGDEFFIRGFGRFKLQSIDGSTKKGKTIISLIKFI